MKINPYHVAAHPSKDLLVKQSLIIIMILFIKTCRRFCCLVAAMLSTSEKWEQKNVSSCIILIHCSNIIILEKNRTDQHYMDGEEFHKLDISSLLLRLFFLCVVFWTAKCLFSMFFICHHRARYKNKIIIIKKYEIFFWLDFFLSHFIIFCTELKSRNACLHKTRQKKTKERRI